MVSQPTQDFIREHADDDVRQLALRAAKRPDLDLPYALDQIVGRQTARRKLPTWAATEGIVYPPHLSMEQCSSESAARYKAHLIGQHLSTPGTLVDLTGGFGVDFSLLAPAFRKAVYVERQQHLCAIARDNFLRLGLVQAEVVCADGAEYLQAMAPADVVYLDPARRDRQGARTYAISDCTPDVVALRDALLARARLVLLKLSPMLDWRKAVSDLGRPFVREVHIVSVRNECKELLLLLGEGEGLKLVCVNDDSRFEWAADGETDACEIPFALPQPGTFLYEPNASLMKAGCFGALARRFGVGPLAANSHLFASAAELTDFPGRAFVVDAVVSFNKRDLRERLRGLTQANIAVRNFPMTVAELRKRLKLSEGGSTYLFATTLAAGNHVLIVCRKITSLLQSPRG